MNRILSYSVVTVLIFFFSCTKDDNNKVRFGWLKSGNKLYYDYFTKTDTLKDFRDLLVYNKFYEEDPARSSSYQLMFRILDRDFIVKKGGLYGKACENCGLLGCIDEFEFLYAPLRLANVSGN